MAKNGGERSENKTQHMLASPAWLKALHEQGILGILLLALSIITMAGLLNRASGTLLDPWSNLLHRLLGWGSYPSVLAIIVISILLIIGKIPDRANLPWHVVVGIEIVFLVLLGFTHLLFAGDDPWQMAQLGYGGGYVGAFISGILTELVGRIPTGVILGVALIGGIIVASGWSVQDWLEQLEDWLLQIREKVGAILTGFTPDAAEMQEALPSRREMGGSRQMVLTPVKETLPAVEPSVPKPKRSRHYQIKLPPLTLLDEPVSTVADMEDAQRKARIIEETLAQFDVPSKVVETNWGPRVTQFGVEPGYITRKGQDGEETERKIRVSKISSLNRDLALALAASPIRIEAPVPGRSIVGIEVPNTELEVVALRQVMEGRTFRRKKSPLRLGLGNGVAGHAVIADLAKMPHLLIAGATGAGKSACINAIATGLLFQNSPLTLRLVMIDPKRVELTRYNGLPHLYGRVEVDVERIVGVLQWLVNEMQVRYKKLADIGARHIDEYNKRWQVNSSEYMPRIVVLIDELADLMFFAPEDVEKSICRLAQMARATGMHLVLATQRPSVDVVTGLIKANFPARIAFAVSTGTDSRVILDSVGAETLLGKGDMLFMSPESSKLVRIQGSFVSDQEVARLLEYWSEWAEEQEWQQEPSPWDTLLDAEEDQSDELLTRAIEIVREQGNASASMLQRRMRIGYPRAASLIDEMEARGVIGPAEKGGRPRQVIEFEHETEATTVTAKGK